MPDPTLVALVAGIIAWTYLVHAIVSWLAPVDWWPTGEPPEEDDDAVFHKRRRQFQGRDVPYCFSVTSLPLNAALVRWPKVTCSYCRFAGGR